jgi:hypothetical protein
LIRLVQVAIPRERESLFSFLPWSVSPGGVNNIVRLTDEKCRFLISTGCVSFRLRESLNDLELLEKQRIEDGNATVANRTRRDLQSVTA